MGLSLAMGAAVGRRTVHVVQGQIGVTGDVRIVFTAIIGSCVVVCLFDPVARVGGMAHFLFPGGEAKRLDETRFGPQAIAGLMSGIVAQGGDVARFRACLFGGAKVHDGRRDMGKRNADFAQRYLAEQGVLVVQSGLGGSLMRRIRFSPTDGHCDEVFLSHGQGEEKGDVLP
ncbi:chemotaxis protein CheD [Pseudorhodobacter ferrugineus]|uniref:chemotaxis protein CheD n=1 Tax=Pseudorhodobacter ferrugineus TaxID=77008 RepID=UPI0003B77766|nr:chemotaxis protein CheD [Pseudorhodobacter ferrugineus]